MAWSRGAIRSALRAGHLEEIGYGVFRLGGAAESDEQRALAAVLETGVIAALSHGSATARWDAPGFRLEPFDVTTARPTNVARHQLATIHRPRFDIEPHIVMLDGVPTLSPIATVWSLATSGRVHPKKIERIIDSFWARRLITGRVLADSVALLAKRGRTGSTMMREFAAARPPGYVAPESGLESRFIDVCARNGLGGFTRQQDVGSDNDWLGRVDFLHRHRRLIVQIDSDRYHSALLDAEADRRQTEALEAAGWSVVRISEWQLWHKSDRLVTEVESALRSARTV